MQVENDIYSFGRTFYVLLHHRFPDEKKKQRSSLDRFLLKCCAKDDSQRFHTILEMQDALQHLSKGYLHRNKRRVMILICLCSVLGAWLTETWYDRNKENHYQSLLKQHQYEQAILYHSSDLRAYQEYIETRMKQHGEVGRNEALIQIFQLYEQYPLAMKQDVMRYLIQECIKSKDRVLCEQAQQLINDSQTKLEEFMYLHLISSSVTRSERVRRLAQQIEEVMAMNQENRSVHIELLIACYEYDRIQSIEVYETLIKLYEMQEDMEKKYDLQYEYALWLCDQDPAEMKNYVTMLAKEWQSIERMPYLGNLYMEVFERVIVDEQKAKELGLLKEAQSCLMRWKQKYPKDESVDASLSQIKYLMEKWR